MDRATGGHIQSDSLLELISASAQCNIGKITIRCDGKSMALSKRAIVGLVLLVGLAPHFLSMFQPFFVDEWTTLRNVVEFFSNRTLVPHHTNYPTFYSYLAAPFIVVGAIFHWLASDIGSLQETVAFVYKLRPLDLAIPARFLSVLLLAASAASIYSTVAIRQGMFAGVAAGLIILLSPSLFSYGSYALPDVAVLAFCLFSFSSLLSFVDRYPADGAVRDLLVSSILAGLAISAKYQAGSAIVPVAVAVLAMGLQRRLGIAEAVRLSAYAACCCIGAFLLGSPGWFLAPARFVDGLTFELIHAADGHLGTSGIPVLGQLELLVTHAPVLFLSGIAGIGVWLRSRSTDGWIALAAVGGSIALASMSSKQSLNYLYPGYVGLLYFAGIIVNSARGLVRRVLLVVLVCVAAIFYFQFTKKGLNYFSPNTTDLAESWIYRNVPSEAIVAMDWEYVPRIYSDATIAEIRREYGKYSGPIVQYILQNKILFKIVEMRYSEEWLNNTSAEYVVTSDLVFDRFFCGGIFTQIVPAKSAPIREGFDQRKKFYSTLFYSRSWKLIRSFSTGNGPHTYIFQKGQDASFQAEQSQRERVPMARCQNGFRYDRN